MNMRKPDGSPVLNSSLSHEDNMSTATGADHQTPDMESKYQDEGEQGGGATSWGDLWNTVTSFSPGNLLNQGMTKLSNGIAAAVSAPINAATNKVAQAVVNQASESLKKMDTTAINNSVRNVTSQVASGVLQGLNDSMKGFNLESSQLTDSISSQIASSIGSIGEGIVSSVNELGQELGSSVEELSKTVSQGVDGLGQGIHEQVKDISAEAINSAKGLGKGMRASIEDLTKGAKENIDEVRQESGKHARQFGKQIRASIENVGKSFKETMKKSAAQLKDQFVKGIKSGFEKLGQMVTGFFKGLESNLDSIILAPFKIFGMILDGLCELFGLGKFTEASENEADVEMGAVPCYPNVSESRKSKPADLSWKVKNAQNSSITSTSSSLVNDADFSPSAPSSAAVTIEDENTINPNYSV